MKTIANNAARHRSFILFKREASPFQETTKNGKQLYLANKKSIAASKLNFPSFRRRKISDDICSVVSKFSNLNNLSIKPGICIYSTLSIYRHVIVARQYFLV